MVFNKKILILFLAVFVFAAPLSVCAAEDDTAETVTLSRDNSLKSLTLSSGTLSPEFSGSTTNYTATVDYSVTDIVVDAQLSNSTATIESISGNTDLAVGENNIYIKVISEAGTEAVYTIVVTRLSAEESGEEEIDEADTDTEAEKEDPKIIINEDGTVSIDGETYEVYENNYISEPEGQVYSEAVYNELDEQYKSLKKKAVAGIVIGCIIIVFLIFMLVNVVLRSRVATVDEPVFEGGADDDAPSKKQGIRDKIRQAKAEKAEESKDADENTPAAQDTHENEALKDSKKGDEVFLDLNSDIKNEKDVSMDTLGMLAIKMHEKMSEVKADDNNGEVIPEIVIVSPEYTGTESEKENAEVDDYAVDADYEPDEDYAVDEEFDPDEDYAADADYDPDEDYAAEDTDYAAKAGGKKASDDGGTTYAGSESGSWEEENAGRRGLRGREAIFDTMEVDTEKAADGFLSGKKEVTNKKSTIDIIDLNDL